MGWLSLGTVSVSENWQQFDTPVVGDVLLRVQMTKTGVFNKWLKRVHFSEAFATGELKYSFSLPIVEETLIRTAQLQTPYKDAGYILRYLAVKHDDWGLITEGSLEIALSYWEPTEGESPFQVLDAGFYV